MRNIARYWPLQRTRRDSPRHNLRMAPLVSADNGTTYKPPATKKK